ncbi:MAG: hypothetical protein A3E37_04755 [Candidatus Andersenbacteria bacterium RIFCSPHIGHO2_12_FULL_46_9]|nr:MAG: hypothetical protein A3B76_03920 [Candidatus Andersenbacteria bacterium RIFCSPHIGHO2_02_FULL_46_16]OGY37678.1 MAG: hypothetical protein A3I08_00675 [Candidatus Andersenbacteria bacterium RIFCSPLOWO2_02_FULL_46_11]OGY38293.1 MAG: hypothetical protein A3E37_04755 [Candidatus Andersenbacteria bacterium RIFCSPHIGHO2_12_FULL_46_9]OGY42948.1 MAG: hypothetical protein A3G57_03640 [Candidatus Andersenbacteria bacterium RIFCSPLOWO2_12_FULL_45_8]
MLKLDGDFLKVYKFCPKCGGTMKPKEQRGEVMPTCTNQICGFIFWQNSNPCVVTIIQDARGLVLMTKRGIEPDKGKLDLPGGFMKLGEHPLDAARRETREELGVEVEIIDLVGVEMDSYFYQEISEATLVLGFTARIVKGRPYPADPHEITSVVWVDPNNRQHDLAFTNNEKFLKRLRDT